MFKYLSVLLTVSGALLMAQPADSQTYQANWDSLDRRATPAWFIDAKFGIFVHWGVYSVPAFAPVGIPKEQPYAEWYWHSLNEGKKGLDPSITETWKFHQRVYGADFPYQDFAPQFRAELFDPTAWADLFKRSGAKYVVLTSKHHDGFALWPSEQASKTWGRPWNSTEVGPHRDLVGDLSTAVRATGLKMGLYYSLFEWSNPLWLTDKPRYVSQHMLPQLKDLVTRYKPSIIFSDGEWDLSSADWRSPEFLTWLFNDSPVKEDVVVNDRWGKETRHKHGSYWTTEYTAGMMQVEHPWEENRGMGFSYGYNRAEKLEQYHTGRELVLMLVDTVSRGGNLLLDVGPAADGTIPVVMEERLTQIGRWLQINGDAIYGTHSLKCPRQYSAGAQPNTSYNQQFMVPYDVAALVDSAPGTASIDMFFTAKGNSIYAILPHWRQRGITIHLPSAKRITSITLLGSTQPVAFTQSKDDLTITLPELPETLRDEPAWTLKMAN
jgi:alpha-L-fucosidase